MLTAMYHMSLVAVLSLVVGTAPAFMGVAYAVRPTEARLALMRPVSLAAIFAALCGLVSGLIAALHGVGVGLVQPSSPVVALGVAEALVPALVAFGCLTIGWLAVALGLRRHS